MMIFFLFACPTGSQMAPQTAVPVSDYDRKEWGGWRDDNKDCQDARQEVLIRQSEEPVTFKDERQCKVATGRWTCPYTGETFTDPGQLDVDHMVPLKEAHWSGGHEWDRDRKRSYYNDLTLGHLVAVSASSNRSKGSRDPASWFPPSEEFHCGYLKAWMSVKERWGLSVDCDEAVVVAKELAQTCEVKQPSPAPSTLADPPPPADQTP